MTNRIPGSPDVSRTAPSSEVPALTHPTAQALQHEMRGASPNWDNVHSLLSQYRQLSPEARAEVRSVIESERIAPRASEAQEDSTAEIIGKVIALILGIIPGLIWIAIDESNEAGARRSEDDARNIRDGIFDLQPPPPAPLAITPPAAPPTPVVETDPTVSGRQLSALAGRLREITQSQISALDIFTLLGSAGTAAGFTWGRRMGAISEQEATDLVAAARRLPVEDQRVLAAALSVMLGPDGGARRDRDALARSMDFESGARTSLRAYINDVERANPPSNAYRAAGNLLATLDAAALMLERTRTELGGIVRDRERATRDGRPAPDEREIRVDNLDAEFVAHVRTALARLPPELREAGKAYLRGQLERTVVPPGVTEPAALRDLRALAAPGAAS